MVTGLYAMWVAKFIKVVEVVSKVDIMETSVGVIMVGEAISVGLFVGGSVGSDISVELAEDKVEGKVRNQHVLASSYRRSKMERRQEKMGFVARMWWTDSQEIALNMLIISRRSMAWDGTRRLAWRGWGIQAWHGLGEGWCQCHHVYLYQVVCLGGGGQQSHQRGDGGRWYRGGNGERFQC